MKYKTENVNTGGTSLQGEITCDYNKLVELFGEPSGSDGYKSDAEWEIEFEDGVVATIYNWKDGKNYCGEDEGLDVEDIRNWHVGGFSKTAFTNILKVIS